MINYFLKSVVRSYSRNKLFTISNIVSLSIGLSISLLIFLWIFYQFSFNSFPEKNERIYRIVENKSGAWAARSAILQSDLAERLKENFPEIEYITKISYANHMYLQTKKGITRVESHGVCSDFFKIFTTSFIYGNPNDCLKDVTSAVITESLAKKLYPNEVPFGKVLNNRNVVTSDVSESGYIITGVIKDFPYNSDFRSFNLFLNSTLTDKNEEAKMRRNVDWGGSLIPFYNAEVYLILNKHTDKKEFERKITKFIYDNTYSGASLKTTFTLQSFSDIHPFSSDIICNIKGSSIEDIKYIYILSGIAILFLVGTLLNFFGYTLITFTKKIKEVGVNKFLGADSISLFKKISLHSIVTLSISILLSGLLSVLIYNNINRFSYILPSGPQFFISFRMILFAFFILILGLLPGLYVSSVVSKIRSYELLQNRIVNIDIRKNLWRIFIAGQIAIPLFLITCTIIIFNQINYLSNYDVGYDKQNVISFNTYNNSADYSPENNAKRIEYARVMKTLLSSYSSVESVTRSTNSPVDNMIGSGWSVKVDGNYIPVNSIYIDKDFFKTWGIKLIKSVDFENLQADFNYTILTEKTARNFKIDYKNKQLPISWNDMTIIGIVENIHVGSFKEKKRDLIFFYPPEKFNVGYQISVKVKPGSKLATMNFINKQWKELTGLNSPGFISTIQRQYEFFEEELFIKVLTLFGSLTLFMALISIFSTVSFNIKNKTKEIGIRKIMGASSKVIFFLVTRDIIILIFAAGIVIVPFVYLVMNKWLQDFPYQVNISIWEFAISVLVIMIISFITISYHSLKAARANPVEALKYE